MVWLDKCLSAYVAAGQIGEEEKKFQQNPKGGVNDD